MDQQKLKDHREIGIEQELFFISNEVGVGQVMWLPKGAIIRRTLEDYMIDMEISEGYQHVVTPDLAKVDLYKKSGHWEHYQDAMFPVMKRENEEYVLRPMNCPHHIEVFEHKPRSYKELPLRIAEFGTIYRWENSGELFGLMRVRNMTLNDAHIFATKEQMKDEFIKVVKLVEKVYKDLKIKDFWYRLSLHDPKDKEKFVSNPEMWQSSETALREALDELGLKYKESIGDAAFYGPKLDVQIPNALGRDETVSTVQIDFLLPEKFGLSYIGEDGSKHPVVMIHRAIVSTLERMVAFLIEQYQGSFPLWLSPVQVAILPIADRHNNYAKEIVKNLTDKGIRAIIDDKSDRLDAKIRNHTLQKVPYLCIIGDREIEKKQISVRDRSGKDLGGLDLSDFVSKVLEEIDKKT